MATCFQLLRHGQTIWNREKRLQGIGDSPLTAQGKEQIGLLHEYLLAQRFDRIVASDLGRVRQTVAVITKALPLPVHLEAGLREQSWGAWEGLTLNEVRNNHGAILDREVKKGWDFRAPEGESRQEVRIRVFHVLEKLHQTYPNDKILLVCHLGIIKCILYAIAGRQFLPDEPKLVKNERLHEVVLGSSGTEISRLNIDPMVQGE